MNDFLKVTCPTHTCYMSVRITPHGSVARVSNTVSCVCVCVRERERERETDRWRHFTFTLFVKQQQKKKLQQQPQWPFSSFSCLQADVFWLFRV